MYLRCNTKSNLKCALISDELTRSGLSSECAVTNVTPLNYKWILKFWKPDILFVESAWKGVRDSWKFKIAAYPDYPKRNNSVFQKVIKYARDLGVPSVFWNKEDGVHFDRFIESAQCFDHVFTVDSNCIERYRSVLPIGVSVHPLLFAVQPALHNFTGFNFKYHRANFVGSYSSHIHDRRRQWQDMLFTSVADTLGLTVFDRNSGRRSENYRYPAYKNLELRAAVPYSETAQIYKDYLVSLNVNTIEDSPTMFSRRLVEIIACGGIAVTTPARSVDELFRDYCHVVSTEDEARELFERLQYGPSDDDLERARAGAEFVAQHHTWKHRLEEVLRVVENS